MILLTPLIFFSAYIFCNRYLRKNFMGRDCVPSVDVQDVPLPLWIHLVIIGVSVAISVLYIGVVLNLGIA